MHLPLVLSLNEVSGSPKGCYLLFNNVVKCVSDYVPFSIYCVKLHYGWIYLVCLGKYYSYSISVLKNVACFKWKM